MILNWNTAENTLACVASVLESQYQNLEVLVVDNGSTDDSVARLRNVRGVTLIENTCNLGFTGGCNTGIRQALRDGTDYVWLLNSDAQVEPGTLGQLVAAAEADPRIGLASPVIRDAADGASITFCCGLIAHGTLDHTPTNQPEIARAWHAASPERISLHGTALLVRRALIETIGELDDRFFAYWEDIDYSIRSARAGFRNVVVLECSVLHEAKAPTTEPGRIKPHYFYYMARNEILLWRKHGGSIALLRVLLWSLQRQLRQLRLLRGNRVLGDALLAGVWDGWRGAQGSYHPACRMPEPLRTVLARYADTWLRLLGGRQFPQGNLT